MTIASVNPATGETLATFTPHDDAEVEARLAAAAAAAAGWRRTPVAERTALVARAAELLDERREALARLATLEMGKTLAAARAEVEKCAWVCRHYAAEAAGMLAAEKVATDARRSFVRFDPLGVVLAVMPWNFPYWQVFRFAAPALAAGNAALLKHASNVPQCALAIEAIWRDAGAPAGLFGALLVGGARVAPLLADPRIAAATLTGSEPAGASVARAAGESLKKVVLELGGSDPFLVLPSADLDRAVATAVTARVLNNGQSCIAAKRFLVHRDVYEPFTARFVAAMGALRMGDPLASETDLGPLATPAIRAELHAQVERSVAAGARLLLGGSVPAGPGCFYPPTVLAEVPPDAPAAREELFGPVAPLFRVDSLDEAIALANATDFGLGAAAFTTDPAEQERLAAELDAGSVFCNGLVKSDPRLPFGGIKRSGFGRELAAFGLREFVNAKTVWIG
ncbi:MAG: NAD-dependent succinate-semialdehyde dehydrogenase [Thermoanaerobaculia bacterium]|nr:NAD-dependent succinate-semialdehyde dehydrogenase [Thermoanaerobaculia bacterium]MBP8846312.1 NAD-dependent succinate-semialdehyde dehydrogenase [Thermoanaerobaculia bacterium]HPA96670.1 NAD-dependent succinate-semialdehyde dehydrogenase [Thermoanaerobaculia bacterium]HQN39276.1 NAD-dependent succinate-semialdehyde dehydrogenase [Thermoanaerobaculia bacterium]